MRKMNRALGADRYKYRDWRKEKKGELGPRKLLSFVKKEAPVKLV